MQMHLCRREKGEKLQDIGLVAFRVALAYSLALIGGLISFVLAVSHKQLCRLISFAAGTLLGVTLFSIIPESYAILALWQFALALISGYATFFLISRYIFHVCPACAASHFDEATTHRFSEIAMAMVLALGLHSTMDGLALAMGKEPGMSGGLDATLLLAVCIHKIPEGLALCALLLAAGRRRTIALIWVAAVEATTLFGGAMGLWARPNVPSFWLNPVMAHVGGGFIFLALHAVFGELIQHGWKNVFLNFSLGMLSIATLKIVLYFL